MQFLILIPWKTARHQVCRRRARVAKPRCCLRRASQLGEILQTSLYIFATSSTFVSSVQRELWCGTARWPFVPRWFPLWSPNTSVFSILARPTSISASCRYFYSWGFSCLKNTFLQINCIFYRKVSAIVVTLFLRPFLSCCASTPHTFNVMSLIGTNNYKKLLEKSLAQRSTQQFSLDCMFAVCLVRLQPIDAHIKVTGDLKLAAFLY